MNWTTIKQIAIQEYVNRKLPRVYSDRLKYEFKEIEKQGANASWVEAYLAKKKWDTNPNGHVLLWLLDMTSVDPVSTSFVYKEDITGDVDNILKLTLEDGSIIEIPEKSDVQLMNGQIKSAKNLQVDDDL